MIAPASGKPAEHGHFLLERRARLVRPCIPAGASVALDFGCGNGAQTILFRDHFVNIFGIDIDHGHLESFARNARERQGRAKMQPLHMDGETIPLPDDAVDCLFSFEVLEHVADEASILAEWRRVLRSGGTAIISVPNRWWIFETHGASLPWLPWNRVPFFSWLPKKLHDRYARARIYRRREIVSKLEQRGFAVHSAQWITAPMDVVPWKGLRHLLRRTLFRADATSIPFLSTSILVIAKSSK